VPFPRPPPQVDAVMVEQTMLARHLQMVHAAAMAASFRPQAELLLLDHNWGEWGSTLTCRAARASSW